MLGRSHMTDLELQLLQRNTMALEASSGILRDTYTTLLAIQRIQINNLPTDYQYDLSAFPNFDWDTIGARIVHSDRYGAAAVTWGGHTYIRRSPQNKFGDAIWFSRCKGKGESGENVYVRLITFKRHNNKAEPLPERVSHQVATASLRSN